MHSERESNLLILTHKACSAAYKPSTQYCLALCARYFSWHLHNFRCQLHSPSITIHALTQAHTLIAEWLVCVCVVAETICCHHNNLIPLSAKHDQPGAGQKQRLKAKIKSIEFVLVRLHVTYHFHSVTVFVAVCVRKRGRGRESERIQISIAKLKRQSAAKWDFGNVLTLTTKWR